MFRLKSTKAVANALEDGDKTIREYAKELCELDTLADNGQDLDNQQAILQVRRCIGRMRIFYTYLALM